MYLDSMLSSTDRLDLGGLRPERGRTLELPGPLETAVLLGVLACCSCSDGLKMS